MFAAKGHMTLHNEQWTNCHQGHLCKGNSIPIIITEMPRLASKWGKWW